MELDELKTAWERLEGRIEAAELRLLDYRKERQVGALRRLLMRLTAGQVLQVCFSLATILVAAPFWIEHRHSLHLLLAGLTLHIYGIAMICLSVTQILMIGQLYYTESVVQCQKRTLTLQRLRVISGLALGLPWWLLWVPATMVGAQRFVGIDLYRASPGWIQLTILTGVAGMVVCIGIARRLAADPPKSRMLRDMIEGLSGRSLARTIRQLGEIERFAGE